MLMLSNPAARENVEGPFRLPGGVDAAEGFQDRVVPGLHAHADAVYAEGTEGARFFQRDGGGVDLEGPLGKRGEVEAVAKAAQQGFELRDREGAWRSARAK